MKLCLNDSNCISNGQCVSGICVCTSQHFTGKHDEHRYNSLTLPMVGAIVHDIPSSYHVYIFICIILTFIGLISSILSFITFIRGRVRYTVCGVYLITFSICAIILMILFITNIIITIRYDNYLFRLWACHGHPYLFLVMINMSILMTVGIAIENVLVRYFTFDRFRSRKCSVFIVLYLFVLGFASNLDKVLTRNLISDQLGQFYCTYDYRKTKFWFYINNSITYFYMIIPCVIHTIFILFIIFEIIKQKQKSYRKIFTRMDILLPSFVVILCLCTYGTIRYLLDSCIINSKLLYIRLHIACLLILYIPQIFIFALYVLPNKSYLQEFKKTWIYQVLCYCLGYKKLQTIEFQSINKLWHRRHSLESVMAISTLNDYLLNSEIYKNIKLEV
ncbi:unnamed protein product [Rotaria socialis]